MNEEYPKEIIITEEEASHPGFFYAMAKARSEMEDPICEPQPEESAYDFLCRLQGTFQSGPSMPTLPFAHSIIHPKVARLILKSRAAASKQERLCKIKRKQKRAAFRRRKRGLA